MKRFLFENIWLISYSDKRARSFPLHPRTNLIMGRNHTGKSSLIKALFLTLGARPSGKLLYWDTNAASLVQFSVNETTYFALHQSGNRALFDEDKKLIMASGDFKEWSKKFSEITSFNLLVTDKHNNTVIADPRCFFLPFYINQDGSWQASWNTFTGLQQYKKPTSSVLEYFSGIKPPEYYELNATRKMNQSKLDELRNEQRFLDRAQKRLAESLTLSGPKIDPSNFELEIKLLTSEVTELNQLQESLKYKLVREQELIKNIHLQINLATETLKTYDKDSKFLDHAHSDNLQCPTCGAEHSEPFLELLTYAEDARVLRELINRLFNDVQKANIAYENSRKELQNLNSNYQKISSILNTRRGEMRFNDVVESAGSEKAFHAFQTEFAAIISEIEHLLGEIESISNDLKKLSNPKRSKNILKIFRDSYTNARFKLNLPPTETSKLSLTSRPDLSGSGGPRSILAYYAALWRTCASDYSTFFLPIIIDSPNQQGQDDINMPRILDFISNDLPKASQVIISTEMGTEHIFDNKIQLDEPYRLLKEEFLDEVDSIVAPCIKLMFESMMS